MRVFTISFLLLIVNTITEQLPSSINVVPLNQNVEQSESPYKFEMGIDKHPAIPCSKEYSDEEALKFKEFIEQDYHYNLYLDGLPAAVRVRNPMTDELEATNYQEGIPIGYYDA